MNNDILVIVPARAGSKGVVDKNIKELGGLPLIQYTVNSAVGLNKRLHVVVNSDSQKYLDIVHGDGVEKYLRDPKLAQDDTQMLDVLDDMLSHYWNQGRQFSAIMILQPTCPFRLPAHITHALEIWEKESPDSLISVTAVEDMHPARMYRSEQGRLRSLMAEELESRNRQGLPKIYHRNGLIYLTKPEVLRGGRIISERPAYLEIDVKFACNIDNELDWLLAETLLREDVDVRRIFGHASR